MLFKKNKMHLFYTPEISSNTTFSLNEAESKHAILVLRLKEQDKITLIDGKGNFYYCQITLPHKKKCEVEILSITKEATTKSTIHIAIAPTKNMDRLMWFVEKCTEIGITEITPILCSHAERKTIREDRLIKTAIAAIKQSLKATLPKINQLTLFNELIKTNFSGQKFIAHCYNEHQISLLKTYKKGKNALILIGPEGDFSKDEINLAINHNFEPVTFGKNRLRTETAGVVACHTINLLNEVV